MGANTPSEVVEICRKTAEIFKEIVEKEYYKLSTPINYKEHLKKGVLRDLLSTMNCKSEELYVRTSTYLRMQQQKLSMQSDMVSDLYLTFITLKKLIPKENNNGREKLEKD